MNSFNSFIKYTMLTIFASVKRLNALKQPFDLAALSLPVLVILNGCSTGKLLVGSVDPVDQPSKSTHVNSLTTQYPNWIAVEPEQTWQNQKTASVISINSACRAEFDQLDWKEHAEASLSALSKNLLSQWRDLKVSSEKKMTISGFPALENSGEGSYLGQKRSFQTIVVRSKKCVYDLIFLAPPRDFSQDLPAFIYFRDNLTLE